MNLNCQTILKMTEAQLRYKSDVSLQEAPHRSCTRHCPRL